MQLVPKVRFLDCRVELIGQVHLVTVELEIDGTPESRQVRSGFGRNEGIHSAIRQMLPLPCQAMFLRCDIEESGRGRSAAVRLGWHGQLIVGHGTDESEARAVALANLNAVSQILCGGPTH